MGHLSGRLVSLLLALAAVLSLGVPASALGGWAEPAEPLVLEALGDGAYGAVFSADSALPGEDLPWTDATQFSAQTEGNGAFYHQLTLRQKALYDAIDALTLDDLFGGGILQVQEKLLYRTMMNVDGVTGTTLEGTLSNRVFTPSEKAMPAVKAIYTDMMAAIVALRYDRPEKLWLNNMRYGYAVEKKENSDTMTVTYAMFDFYLEHGEDTRAMVAAAQEQAALIAQAAADQPDLYSRVKAVYEALAARNTYGDTAKALSHDAYSALVPAGGVSPVCDGYAKAFKMVLDRMGVPCVLASGSDHMWNNVKMDDGEWYDLDLTLEDTQSETLGAMTYTYFLVGRDTVIGEQAFSKAPIHTEINPYEAYRKMNPTRLNAVTLTFPAKSHTAYRYQGQNYEPLRFPDVVRSAWYYGAVEETSRLELFSGYEDGRFLPLNNITRAEFAQVLANALRADLSGYDRNTFSDVPAGRWYTKAVCWAHEQGYVQGDKGRFRPNDNITRQEMCVVLDRVLKDLPTPDGEAEPFRDDGKIAAWAKASVYRCRLFGLVQGDDRNNFLPGDPTQRCAAAQVFSRFMKLLETPDPEGPIETEPIEARPADPTPIPVPKDPTLVTE